MSFFTFPLQINPYTAALYGNFGLNPFFPGRSSRDMSLRELDGLSRMTGKVKNVTCVMQELGYVSYNLKIILINWVLSVLWLGKVFFKISIFFLNKTLLL